MKRESEEMNRLIQGIHHVCIKCTKDEIAKVKHFYGELLGLPILRSWGKPELEGFMFETGAGLVEVFTNASEELSQGSIRHFAFKTSNVDKCIQIVRDSGYKVTVEPKDIVIASNPAFPARVAFCIGPVGEEIEFFEEK